MPTTENPPARTMMNGKPVFTVPVKTVLNLHSGFEHKLLCDGPALALGDACAYNCAFCYVPAIYQKVDRVRLLLERIGKRHDEVVILRENALSTLTAQLRHPTGKPKYRNDPTDRRVVYASPADDVAANMDLVRATVAACAEILRATHWHIRLLSKSPLLPRVAELLIAQANSPECWEAYSEKDVRERMIFGFSTGTLDDKLARAFEEGTPLVSKRIQALHELQDAGFRTFGMVCPSLPMADGGGYSQFSYDMLKAIRVDRCEHVWAEVINLRGESFKRTRLALLNAGFDHEAELLTNVSEDTAAWEHYNRTTFLCHAFVMADHPGKLRYLTYVTPQTSAWWADQKEFGAVVL